MLPVLLVEDDLQLKATLSEELSEEGIFCDSSGSYNEAVKSICENDYALIVLDISLDPWNPENVDGIRLLEFIRQGNQLRPVIMLSGLHDLKVRVRCFDAGCDDYLLKPFDINELVAVVKRHLERTRHFLAAQHYLSSTREFSLDGLHVDLSQMRIYNDRISIEGKVKLVRLLHLFYRNRGRVLTSQLIYSLVWNNDDYDENTLRVHISRLRGVLDQECNQPELLKTIRGVGYLLQYQQES